MDRSATRRAFIVSLLAGAAHAAKRRLFPSRAVRYTDRLTEFPVDLLTNPAHASRLPLPSCRAASLRNAFLVYASRREGAPQLFLLDHKKGTSQQLTDASTLAETEFALLPRDRELLFIDRDSLRILTLSSARERELYRVRAGWRRETWLALTSDGSAAILIETRDGVYEVRRIPLAKQDPETVLQAGEPVAGALSRPGAAGFLWRSAAGALWMSEGADRRKLPTPAGTVNQAWWQPDGASISYLHSGPDGRTTVREIDCANGAELSAAQTSRYVHFAPNADGSVFVGASGSLASPNILLLHRKTRRELTLCEHACRDAALAAPVFSPDSRRVYFTGDADGNAAIRSVDVSRLVEET
ncbi:MAG TPA: hypothetical protein VN428_04650 [Bryobacteraceae bacterium]|nr:hypothetical protein [Bryobacteraceae bacterium]